MPDPVQPAMGGWQDSKRYLSHDTVSIAFCVMLHWKLAFVSTLTTWLIEQVFFVAEIVLIAHFC